MEQSLLSSDCAGKYVNWMLDAGLYYTTSIFTNYVGKYASPHLCKLFAWKEQQKGKAIPKVIIQGILRGQIDAPYEYAKLAVENNWPIPKEIKDRLMADNSYNSTYNRMIDPAHGYVDPSYDFYGGDYSPEEDDNENDNDPEDDELNRVKQLAERLNR